jgi:excisionase family DNA binding protein
MNTYHPLMTVDEAAQTLRCSKYTVRNWLSTGKLAPVKIGRKTFLDRKDVEGIVTSALKAKA